MRTASVGIWELSGQRRRQGHRGDVRAPQVTYKMSDVRPITQAVVQAALEEAAGRHLHPLDVPALRASAAPTRTSGESVGGRQRGPTFAPTSHGASVRHAASMNPDLPDLKYRRTRGSRSSPPRCRDRW